MKRSRSPRRDSSCRWPGSPLTDWVDPPSRACSRSRGSAHHGAQIALQRCIRNRCRARWRRFRSSRGRAANSRPPWKTARRPFPSSPPGSPMTSWKAQFAGFETLAQQVLRHILSIGARFCVIGALRTHRDLDGAAAPADKGAGEIVEAAPVINGQGMAIVAAQPQQGRWLARQRWDASIDSRCRPASAEPAFRFGRRQRPEPAGWLERYGGRASFMFISPPTRRCNRRGL